MNLNVSICRSMLAALASLCLAQPIIGKTGETSTSMSTRLHMAADNILEQANVSYVYGGGTVGESSDCDVCNACIEREIPKSKMQLATCPECSKCGLDCSHFVQMVYGQAGIAYPYIETRAMLDLPDAVLLRRYGFVSIGRDLKRLMPGDLLVYKGHVVLLEALHEEGVGDVVHATGGRDIKGPGLGVQRERHVPLANFRGPLLRILRHKQMYMSIRTESGKLSTRTGNP